MLIKISALIYTLASIAFITLMIMRPAVEIETQPVPNNTITVNTDSNTSNTESDSEITPVANPNANVDTIPANTAATAMESTTPAAVDNAAMPEVAPTMPVSGVTETAPQDGTATVVPTPLDNAVDTNQTNSAAPATMPTSPPATTVIPAAAPVPAAPSQPATTTIPVPVENPAVVPSAVPSTVPTEVSPTPVSPQSHLSNPENQGANTVHNSAPVAIPATPATPTSAEPVVFPNNNTTIPNQVTTPSLQPSVTDAVQQLPSNVINTPLADVLPEDEKKNIQ